jgi:ABC-type transport system involved in multi-copper enzyme maturation permease subunit
VSLHLGLGPVFKFECLAASRRWQYFAGRALFIGLLLAALGLVVWNVEMRAGGPIGLRGTADAGEKFYIAIMSTQLALLFLIAPAVAADSICLDKARGALLPLLTTDLSSREIVLGKLFARFLPILGFVFCGLPVLAICFTMGGIHPEVVFGAFLVCLGVALMGGTMAIVLSIWCTKTYEVLLICYLFWIAFLLVLPVGWMLPAGTPLGWAKYSNPIFLCLAPYMDPGSVAIPDFIYFFGACIGLSTVLIVIAIVGLRRAIIRHGSVVAKKGLGHWWSRPLHMRWLPRPSLDGNPVLWREWQRQQPSRWVRVVWWLYGLTSLGFVLYCFMHIVLAPNVHQGELGPLINAFQVSVGLLLVSVSSVTSLQEERVHGSMDVLLTTPLSTVQIYWGKWWGSFRLVLLLTILPTFLVSGLYVRYSLDESNWFWPLVYTKARYFVLMPLLICCYGAATVSIGLALAIWIKGAGRAMATSVAIYVFITVGMLMRPLLGLSPDESSSLGSSFMAAGYLTVECLDTFSGIVRVIPTLMIYCIAYSIVAALFSLLACRSFDRSLGRMPDQMSASSRAERVRQFRRSTTRVGESPV